MHVFLSYSRRDAAFVGRLADDLGSRGIDPWLDTEDLPTDDEDRWRRSVVQGIRESAAVVLVLSPDSVRSPAVERELTLAAEMTRRIIPIMHRTCVLSDGVLFELAGLQRTDFVDQPYETAIEELVDRIVAGTATSDRPRPGVDGSGTSADRGTGAPTRGQHDPDVVPVVADPARHEEGERPAASEPPTGVHTAPADVRALTADQPHGRRKRLIVGASVVALIGGVVAGNALLRDNGADDDTARISTPSTTGRTIDSTDRIGPVVPASSASETAEGLSLVPWDMATATLQRRDGTTATVNATSVALGCATGTLKFKNGQTVSLERVQSIRFEAINLDNASAEGSVTLLDGRELLDPIDTWNCPISGTTELGPLTIQLEDIQRIDFNR